MTFNIISVSGISSVVRLLYNLRGHPPGESTIQIKIGLRKKKKVKRYYSKRQQSFAADSKTLPQSPKALHCDSPPGPPKAPNRISLSQRNFQKCRVCCNVWPKSQSSRHSSLGQLQALLLRWAQLQRAAVRSLHTRPEGRAQQQIRCLLSRHLRCRKGRNLSFPLEVTPDMLTPLGP